MHKARERWRGSDGSASRIVVLLLFISVTPLNAFNPLLLTPDELRLSVFPDKLRSEARNRTKEMFYFGWENYLSHAFPADELDPIHCTGRGHDHAHPENININDVLGDYSLTLVDALDSLVVMGDVEGFHNAVKLVIDTVSFDRNTTVQVFEATIRVLGSLLSAHLIASDQTRLLGNFYMAEYDGEMLDMARDLAARLLPAFEGTATGLPYPRVNLQRGVVEGTINETCTAGAGSLALEFGILSRLTGDPIYASIARRINQMLWTMRQKDTGLFGNVVNIQTGAWVGHLSGLGAGLDSYFEYLLKAYIMFGAREDLDMFNEAYAAILGSMRRGRDSCTGAVQGEPPLYVNVDSRDGSTANTWIDSLQASFPAVQTLAGDVEEAICHHAVYYAVWKKYGVLPERFNWLLKKPDVAFYPLRPEFVESTYHLYRATRSPFYLHVGNEILDSFDRLTRVQCGFATVHDVRDGTVEDRMESFFLSETLKYLYLLFDDENTVNVHQERLLFSTEGHIFPLKIGRLPCPGEEEDDVKKEAPTMGFITEAPPEVIVLGGGAKERTGELVPVQMSSPYHGTLQALLNESCATPSTVSGFGPPLREEALISVFRSVGVDPASWF